MTAPAPNGYRQGSLKNVWQDLTEWWRSEEKALAWTGVLALVGCSLLSVYIAVHFNIWSRDFFTAIEQKDIQAFFNLCLFFIPLLLVTIMEYCARQYLAEWLSFRWRRWMTTRLYQKWLFSKGYYLISLTGGDVDNPDQRIASDVNNVSYYAVYLTLIFFREGVNFLTFSIILWSLSSELSFILFGHTIAIPGLLVWIALLYCFLGLLGIFKVGEPLIALDRTKEKLEADFRYLLIRVFERREEIAKLSGEKYENNNLKESFLQISHNFYEILKRNLYINFLQNFYMNSSMFVPLFLVGPFYFSGLLSFGVMMQIREIFGQVNVSLSSIALNYCQFASLVASFQRLYGFNKLIDERPSQILSLKDFSELQVKDMTIFTPQKQVIWQPPKIKLQSGDRKILLAPSGRGKTSLLRVLAGIYPYFDGDMAVPHDTMIVPQRPYMPIGTLRQCLAYPESDVDEKKLIETLKGCQLEHLIPYLDNTQDYQHYLSLGEQQRINFVRVLLHGPRWLIMDEPTANMNHDYSNLVFKLLEEHLPQTGILLVSHHPIPGYDIIKE